MKARHILVLLFALASAACATNRSTLDDPVLFVWYLSESDDDPSWSVELDRHGTVLQYVQYANHQKWQMRRARTSREVVEALVAQAAALDYASFDDTADANFAVKWTDVNGISNLVYRQGDPCVPEEIARLLAFFESIIVVLPEQVRDQELPECEATSALSKR